MVSLSLKLENNGSPSVALEVCDILRELRPDDLGECHNISYFLRNMGDADELTPKLR